MKSPGHRKWPEHKVTEKHIDGRVRVEVNGELIADSRDVVKVEEDHHPPRYYFPRADVKMDKLSRSATTTECPFKGTAHYFGIRAGDETLEDSVWTYEDPYEEHQTLKDRVAFYDDERPEISVKPAA
jgi:uncharacterized protein (DUF427 family)